MTLDDTAVRAAAPTPLTLDRLSELTAKVAEEVRQGIHEIRFDAEDRWSVRLHADDYTDVWLISWTPDQSTRLHDHAGSLGALTVVTGELVEHYWDGELRERILAERGGGRFPLGHVHDVINTSDRPAVSVHAYSPPLTAMHYYEVTEDDSLRRTGSILTTDPEPDVPTLESVPAAEGVDR
ncbi:MULTISPECIES: cysteine dioxygenase family protein [unclassified Nocardiopsis]|jgi:predicted metal-dependent enzyme (double-stranded beta helix superfamily)|uniref:cysteine dioxygenase n=1 Tax=unclassified Nocardiopsis TaxID=2649073 RepID=UPI00066CCC0D|nr:MULTISPECIES: cysteine dioxygenase family protein [unclassified Nocardiopsis]MBQ1082869.1 cysteine dioxygenase family protein [Nocardiopsis sp. B62]